MANDNFPGTVYAPPGVYTRTRFDNPVSGVLAGVRIPVIIGTGNQLLQQQDLEVIRGSSGSVDQQVPQEDETGRAVAEITQAGQVVLGDFNGARRRIQVRNFPITSGDGTGTVATDPSSLLVTINGRPDVVLSVQLAEIGVIEISTAPQFGDEVRVTYFFKRTDTRITDTLSDQVTPLAAILNGALGNLYQFASTTNTFRVRVDSDITQDITATFPTGGVSAATVASLINGAASGTSLIASTFTNNFGLTAVRLVADRDLEILDGPANSVLGFTRGQKTSRNRVFYTFNGPIVDGSNGGVTTTDVSKVVVRIDNVLVVPTEVDGQNRAVTLPFAPEVGSVVTIQYYFNSWQDTFDYLANINVTDVLRCGIVPGNRDFIEGSDFVLKDDLIVWGTAFLVNAGITTAGAPPFGPTQISGLLIDNRWFLAPTEVVVNQTVSPPFEDRTKFTVPAQPTTGNGRDTPLGETVFLQVANNRVDLPTNNPNLVRAYWGFGLQDAVQRGTVQVKKVEGTTITLKDAVPVGASVWATFYYNTLVDDEYTVQVETSGPSGIGTYFLFDKNGNPIYTPLLGSKGPALTGITLQFPSGSELAPDVHFEGGTDGPVEETVTVSFANSDATIAKYTVPGSGSYAFISGESDRARFVIDNAALAGAAGGINLSAPHGIDGVGFFASILSAEIAYTDDSGQTTYDVLSGLNDTISMTVDNVVITTNVPAQTGVDADAYVEAINAEAKLVVNSPYLDGITRFLGTTVIAAGDYNQLVFNYTGITNGATGPVTATIAAGTYASPSTLATAVNTALSTAIGALPAQYAGISVAATANAEGQMRFTFKGADTDLGTFASGTITSTGALIGDTVTIGDVVLTGDLAQVSGDLNFDTGQARATIIANGVQSGDTLTLNTGGGPVVLTAAGAQTPGGLNFNEGVRATGSITVVGPIPNDTVTVNGTVFTGISGFPGAAQFNVGTRATGTATMTGVRYGDTFTIDTSVVGGGPVVLTADDTLTPGGLNFNIGTAATGTVTLTGVRPASIGPFPVFAADTVTINGNALTPVAVARTPGANDFNAGVRALSTLTVVATALPSTGVVYGDTVTINGIPLVADNVTTPGGLNFNAGTQATALIAVTASPATATITVDTAPIAGGPYVLTDAGGARTPGNDDYDGTLGTTAAIAADIAAAINDPLNSFSAFVTAAVGPGPAQVTLTWTVPGAAANPVANTSSHASVTVAATFGGGVGTAITTATAIVAAIQDALNGLSTTIQSHNTGGASAVVNLRALTPGTAGNSISTVSTAALRLTFGGATFAGGVGTDTTAAADAVAAILDVANNFEGDVSAINLVNLVTLTAVTPGAAGNLLTLSTTAAGRFALSGALLTGGVGDNISAGTSLVAAIADAANGLGGVLATNVGGTSAIVTVSAFTPGTVGNGITLASSAAGRVVLSAATLLGGVGDDTTVAVSLDTSISAAIPTVVGAIAVVNAVNLTAVTPGNSGNIITLATSSTTRLIRSGPTLAGGSGTNFTVAASIAAAINDAGNGLAATITGDSESGNSTTITIWADTPGVVGNTYSLASSTGVRLPVSGANLTGGATVIQVATSIVNAIMAAGNGLNGIVDADNTAGVSAVVDVTASVPGPTGNFIDLASSTVLRLPVSAATLTGGAGLGGGVFEFLDGTTLAQDFAVLAGLSTDALSGQDQTKVVDGDIVRRFSAAGLSGRLIYDRLIARNRILPGSGSLTYHSQLAQTDLTIQGTNATTETGFAARAAGLAGIAATVQAAALFGEVGFKDGQVAAGTYTDARDGQPAVRFYAAGGVNPQNNVFKANLDGTAFTVVFRDATGTVIPAASQADVPLGPLTVPNTVLAQIEAAAVGAGLAAGRVAQEGAGIRLLSARVDTVSSITINDGNATDTLGFSSGASASRVVVDPEMVASALMMHHSASLTSNMLNYQNPSATYFAEQALAGVARDSTNAEFLFVESQANNLVGLGASSSVTFEDATTDSWLLTGTGLNVTAGSGSAGESGYQGFYVVSSDPSDGSGSANTSVFNNGVGQDGLVGQSYRDEVTGLVFTILERTGGAAYPVGAGASFTFEVRRLVTTNANLPVNSIPGLEMTVANTEGSLIPQGDTAILTTFDRGGSEPQVGDSYYVTYNYSKTEADFETQLFTNMRAVERNYGDLTPDQPVSLAAYMAFLNGAVVLAIKQVAKTTGSNQASTQTYIDALNTLRGSLTGGATLDTITPLKGDDVDLFLALSQHVDIQSSIRYRSERTGIIGVGSGTQPTDVGGIAQQLQNTRMRLLYPDIVTLTIQDALGNDKQFLVDGTYLAAAMAGNRASPRVDVATPWTRARLVGFDSLARRLDAVEENQIAVQGVTVLSQSGTVIRVRQGLTTDMSNQLTKLPTIITISDEVQRSARRDLDRFIGIKFLPGVLSEIEGQLATTMKSLKAAEIITAFTGIQARTTADPTMVEVEAFYMPVFPLLYIVIQFNLRSSGL